jgi:hypothetical protein
VKIELNTVGRSMLIDGERNAAALEVQTDERGHTVRLNGLVVLAKVYRDGVLMADTTVPPLTKRVAS